MAYNAPAGDFVTSALSGVLAAGATSATIGTGLTLPAANGVLQISYDTANALGATDGPETISYTAYNTATGALTGLTRGLAGTTDVQHSSGQSVQSGPSSLYFSNDMSWQPANQTWAYATATTITVPSGAAAIYSVGDKIKLTQTTVKYFYITAVADTTLTVTGGATYTVANAPITSPYYSKLASPVGFPQWFAATAPTFDVAYYDNGSAGQPTTLYSRFCIVGRQVTWKYSGTGTKAGTNAYISITVSNLPAPANYIDTSNYNAIGSVQGSAAEGLIGSIRYDAGSLFTILFQSNITDNTANTLCNFTASWEI